MTPEQIQAKLDALKNNTQKTSKNESAKYRFKPKEGKQVVRLLPNFAFGKDVTFFPVSFYYDFTDQGKFGQTWLAPHQFDEPDAIYDFNQECVKTAYNEPDKGRRLELFKMANKFQSKQLITVALLSRDAESEGIKFWNITVNVMKQLEAVIEDPDYGNIFDLKSGRDITIEYIPKEKTDTGFPKINILPKPKETPASTDKELLESIVKSMPNVLELYTKPTYEQTEKALANYLNGSESQPVESKVEKTVTQVSKAVGDIDIDFDNLFEED
jgi:hypothetical protein